MSTLLEQIERGDWRGEPGEMRVVPLGRPATVDDLRRTDLKAEIVGGEMVVIGPSGCLPARAGGHVAVSLVAHARHGGGGIALGGRVAFRVDLPHPLAARRADYFAAGTLVVWDVDVLREETGRVFRASSPDAPDLFRRGETADAEPAVPGWRMPVDELFE